MRVSLIILFPQSGLPIRSTKIMELDEVYGHRKPVSSRNLAIIGQGV